MAKKAAAEQEIANWEDMADDLPDLPDLVKEFREISDQAGAIEKRKKELSPEIEAAVILGGKKVLTCGSFKVTRVEVAGAKKIAPERVVEKAAAFGLTADQIVELLQYATVEAPGYSYPLVARMPGGVMVPDGH